MTSTGIGAGAEATFVLKGADSVFVPVKLGFVEISGDVVRPGLYPYADRLKLSDCLTMAGGPIAGVGRITMEVTDHVTGVTRTAVAATPVSDGDRVTIRLVTGEL